jgi:SRSO17 transposase
MALEQVDRARANGVHLDWLTFDSEYGKSPEFLRGLDERRQPFVGDVPSTFSCRVATRAGAQPTPGVKGPEARDVVRQAGAFRSQEWQIRRLSRATAEDQVWRVKRARVWAPGAAGWSPGPYWLVWACSDHTGEEKFLVSNAPAECAAEALVRVGFRRAAVEHLFRICKSELGFTHFEGRNYVALRRHLGLCVAMLGFVAEHTQQLRGEKSPGDRGAGVPGPGPTEPRVARAGPGDHDTGLGVGGPRVPPAPQSGRHRGQTTTRRSATHAQNTENAKAETAGKIYT